MLQVPGARLFPTGTIVSGAQFYPGQLAQCVGRFPMSLPAPYRLPSQGLTLYSPPPNNQNAKCAGQFTRFYQNQGPDGGFIVQCTN